MGRHCVYLSTKGFDVVGVDTPRNALRTTKAWSDAEEGAEAKIVRASMMDLPFVSGCFEAVISVSVAHHAMKGNVERTVE